MKKLPIGIQNITELIKENYVYVDKTALVYQLVTGGKYYFFSRPRRFGKSLLVSTLAAIFSGKKELFARLAINALPYDWKAHPVIHISFSSISAMTPERLENGIILCLENIAETYDIKFNKQLRPGEMLTALVRELAKQERVVLLIDEYDYSILRHIHEPAVAEQMREVLKDFYSVIKDLDSDLRFVFLTGVSRFSKTSIFSGLNNLEDISMSPPYSTLVGYTKSEIAQYLQEYLIHISQERNISVEDLLQKVQQWYDGYNFSKVDSEEHIYNPFSVLLFCKNNDFSNYWFETGTPTFLIKLLKTKNYPVQNFEKIEATAGELGQFDIEDIELKTLLFQTGYLTIKSYDYESQNYVLGYVNKETVDSLGKYIIKAMAGIAPSETNSLIAKLLRAFKQLDFQAVFEHLTHFFAEIPYTLELNKERDFQSIFYLILKMLGADIIVEKPTNVGRIDAVLQTDSTIFVIEFKINKTTEEALQQIEDRKYYQAYESLEKPIILVGITFDTQARNVSGVEHKNYKV